VFRSDVLVTEHGADSHREDRLADLNPGIDGRRPSHVALREFAETVTGGRRLTPGGGGYSPVRVLPRPWPHLLAFVAGQDIDPGSAAAHRLPRQARGGQPRDTAAGRLVRRHPAPGDLPAPVSGTSDRVVATAREDRW